MSGRKVHRILGMVLLLPFLGWITTGIVFLIKPGYDQAYAQLALKTYPLEREYQFSPQSDWQEIRLLRTILGDHLLVQVQQKWQHLDPITLNAFPTPEQADLSRLLDDAVATKPDRYGSIVGRSDGVFQTDTGVELRLDWSTLNVTQRGRDTRLIGTLYKIHYLEWFGNKTADTVLGIFALLALTILAFVGLTLMRKKTDDH